MSGNKLFVDTNIILYILSGDKTIARYLLNQQLYTSVICEIELLSYTGLTAKNKHQIKDFLNEFRIISIDISVKEFSISLRNFKRLQFS